MKRKVVVLVSGGLDSVCALYEAAAHHEVLAGLTFDYAAKHGRREIPFAASHCRRLGVRHEIVRLDFIGKHFQSSLLETGGAIPDAHYEAPAMRKVIVPFRNGIFLAAAAGLAQSIGATAVVIAAHAGDHAIFPDCRPEFMDAMSGAIGLGTNENIEVLRPFIHLSKAQIVQRGRALNADLASTWSCYKGDQNHCGTCGACVERREAFALAAIPDPTQYDKRDLKSTNVK